jgi:protein-S-isoprenylcysteine O-methyltransferase Ste14
MTENSRSEPADKVTAVSTSHTAEVKPPRRAAIPRWAAIVLGPVVFLVVIPLVHGVVPWAIALLGPNYGWLDNFPTVWNLLGLLPVAAGAVVLLWLMVIAFNQRANLPERMELDWSPKMLLMRGPYRFSRHPMYLAELALWLGWAILYGSVAVSLGFVIFLMGASVVAPLEERALEAKFGDAYRQYKAKVSRWFVTSWP